MALPRIDFAPFDGKVDFGIWKWKISSLLSHHKVGVALVKDPKKWTEDQIKRKAEIEEEALNLLVLNLSDNVLRKVHGSKSVLELMSKLESLFVVQSEANVAFLKGSLFHWKMDSSKTIDENLDEFLKLSLRLKNTSHALSDTEVIMILLNAIPNTYHVVKDVYQYSGIVPTYDMLASALKTRELEIKTSRKDDGSNCRLLRGSCFCLPSTTKPSFDVHYRACSNGSYLLLAVYPWFEGMEFYRNAL